MLKYKLSNIFISGSPVLAGRSQHGIHTIAYDPSYTFAVLMLFLTHRIRNSIITLFLPTYHLTTLENLARIIKQ